MSDQPCLREHEFVLVLDGVTDLSPAVLDPLFEAGCDDATASLRHGRVYLSFAREAGSLRQAILSAIRDVNRARIGARVVAIDECNLVSQSDIARRIGRSRQQVGQYVNGTRGPGQFPPPICDLTEGHPMWYWCEVSHWLWENGIVSREVLDESRTIAAVNSALEFLHHKQHDAELMEEVLSIFVDVSPPAC